LPETSRTVVNLQPEAHTTLRAFSCRNRRDVEQVEHIGRFAGQSSLGGTGVTAAGTVRTAANRDSRIQDECRCADQTAVEAT